MNTVQPDPVIRIESLNLIFQTPDAPVHALSNINLVVDQGDFVSFIGPSGCGKTTLMSGKSAPVISKKPMGAYTHAIWDDAQN